MKTRRFPLFILLSAMAVTFAASQLHAGNAYLPNRSFESPLVPPVEPYAIPDMDAWQKNPQPGYYDPTNFFNTPWEYNMGTFTNVPFPGQYIDNCAGNQAAFIFALPGAGIFQDYTSLSGTNVTPTHAFNSKFNSGKSYDLTVGVLGGGGGMSNGVTLQLSLYYRDASNNMVTVAATTITNSADQFPTNSPHFVEFHVHVPTVGPTNAWANQNIGVQIASTVDFSLIGGYWDIDNVRLVEGIDVVPNFSFESPLVPPLEPYAIPDMDAWQKNPQPGYYDPTNFFNTPWEYNMGTFSNVPFPGQYIDNCAGNQAAFIFALPGAGIFQDYTSLSGTNTVPTHDFNTLYTAGKGYSLTVGLLGGGGGMPAGSTLQLSFYYRDTASNQVTIAAATVTNDLTTFPTNAPHFVDFSVQISGVLPTDPWAGKNIGVQFTSTVVDTNLFGGYWDVDNVRLAETVAPNLTNFARAGGQSTFTFKSEPELQFEVQASTNLTSTNWTSLGIVTNLTGSSPFVDPASLAQRFYRAHKL